MHDSKEGFNSVDAEEEYETPELATPVTSADVAEPDDHQVSPAPKRARRMRSRTPK